ncbi:sulfite exporter TauE/SafE family protein [Sciscionella marina]|uniref:sulfite exporter TauE/SafE family protein n=1 Tax=Sciscionella marina TaxID=508770 RepID=UPI00036CE661|nr:sulfite exporter TauE/SafE family protein [Sciscionella marina]
MTVVLLGLFGLLGGIGITALGPGGVLPTIGLFVLTGLSPAQVAGTAIVTHVATGALGTGAYLRSGHLREPANRRTALLLAGAALPGTALGVLLNAHVSARAFGILLGVLVVLAALLVLYRERHAEEAERARPGTLTVLGTGFAVAVVAGIVGIGGPMLTVPLLLAFGVPVLESLAAAQAQSIVIAGIGSIGYAASDAIDWPLAVIIGVPELAGVLIGWVIARRVPTRLLKRVIVVALLALGPYLALHG